MCEVIIARGMSVLNAKKVIIEELKQMCQLDVPINRSVTLSMSYTSINASFDRLRLRKKAWKNPGTIFRDTQLFEEDITIMSSSEIFFEILDGER
jgi:ubiquitin carboxyl-terminal hydrolase 47